MYPIRHNHKKFLFLVTVISGLILWVVISSPVAAAGPCVPGPHQGTISSDESWCVEHSPHVIEEDVIVAEGATLTIEPGGIVVFKYTSVLRDRDIFVNGSLDAQGTAIAPIRFTTDHSSPAKADWGYIRFGDYSTNNVLDYVTVEYGGNQGMSPNPRPTIYTATDSLTIDHSTIRRGTGHGIEIENASPTIQNTAFEDHDGSALYLDGGTCFPTLSGLTATDNTYNAITINGNTYAADYTWGDAGIADYRISSSVTVSEGVTLKIEPGTKIKFTSGYDKKMLINGSLDAQGTTTDTIRIMSDVATPSAGQWSQIVFGDYSTANVLDYTLVEYGGRCGTSSDCPMILTSTDDLLIDHSTIRRSMGDAIRLDDASPTIQNTTIQDNDDAALYLDGAACAPVLSALTVTGNGFDGIVIKGGIYTTDYAWGDAGISTYRIQEESITVNQGATLTISPGTIIKFEGIAPNLIVNGTLLAQGTPTDTIRFTSNATSPSPGNWGYIKFNPSSTNNILEYTTVAYGGKFVNANVSTETGSLTIRHCTITQGYHDGIRLHGAAPIIEFNSILDNNDFGVNNLDDSTTAYARCNWWGHASGPYHPSLNPDGLGQEVSDNVIFSPWLSSEGAECPFYELFLPLIER
jgi:hypothetical protein